MHVHDSRRGALALLGAVVIWASTFMITKIVLAEAGPFTVTFLRFAVGLAVIAPVARRQGFRPAMSVQPAFLGFGLTGIALFYAFQNVGLLYTSAGSAALIESSVTAAIAIASFLMLRERLGTLRVAGIAMTMLGVILISGLNAGSGGDTLGGNLLILGAVVSFAIYTVQGKRLSVSVPPAVSTAASFGAGLLFLLPPLVYELVRDGPPHFTPVGLLIVLFLGAGASALTLFLWNYALQHVDASVAALYTSLVPAIALVFSASLGEPVTAIQIAGGALAIAGVWVGNGAATLLRRA
jgi:drug/metabolite transporter (DMT)-like permease